MTNTNPTAADQARTTVVDRIPTWATSVELEPDGYVVFTRVVREGVEIQQSSHLVLDKDAGTVGYQAVEGLALWIPGLDNSITSEKAREILAHLQELLAVVDEIEAAEALGRTSDLLEMSV